MRPSTIPHLIVACVAACLGGMACGGGGTQTTTGEHLSPDLLTAGGSAPDYSCVGSPDPALSYAVDTPISGIVTDFEEDYAVEGLVVSIYSSLADLLADRPFDTSTPSDQLGQYTILAPANVQRFYFKTIDPTGTDYFDTMEINEPVAGLPPGAPQTTGRDRIAVSAITMETVPAIMGIQRIAGRGIVAGTVFDCAGNDVMNAALRAYDAPQGNPNRQLISIYEGAERNTFYFADGLPSRDAPFTDVNGQFAIANLVAGQTLILEFWGRLEAGSLPAGHPDCTGGCFISTQEIPVLPDTIVVTDMVPLFSQQ